MIEREKPMRDELKNQIRGWRLDLEMGMFSKGKNKGGWHTESYSQP